MKTEQEIREKIEEYMDKLTVLRRMPIDQIDEMSYETEIGEHYGIIDALLWVIGDNSGAKI